MAFGVQAGGSRLERENPGDVVRLFLCGDVMTGRGIDQILPHPCDPHLYEPVVEDAREYVRLAERAHGSIPRRARWEYIWGTALDIWAQMAPDLRVINLETSVTRSDQPWPDKGIHYRMSPENGGCLSAEGVDVAVLGNNHVLDWGYAGLEETLSTLHKAGISTAGAGMTAEQALAPAITDLEGGGRILTFSVGLGTSGVPQDWRAEGAAAGVSYARRTSEDLLRILEGLIAECRAPGDIVLLSIHWGPNWGFNVARAQREFAHRCIDQAGVDVVHGHSSHHVKGIEIHNERPIFYGCGDLITDYEGIRGHEEFRGDLSLMYFVDMEPMSGRILGLRMFPTQIRRFQLRDADDEGVKWLARTLEREGEPLGTRVQAGPDGSLELAWGD